MRRNASSLWTALCVAMLINSLALATVVTWLAMTGRLSRERIDQAAAIFELTLDEQQAREQERLAAQEQDRQTAEELARLERVRQGPATLESRLEQDRQRDELALQRLQLLRGHIRQLEENLARMRGQLEQQKQQLDLRRAEFEQRLAREQARAKDQAFQRAVRVLEQLEPRQGKAVIQERLALGQRDRVLDYLEAMQPRTVAELLNAFRDAGEVAQAADLIAGLRERGETMFLAGDDTPARGASS